MIRTLSQDEVRHLLKVIFARNPESITIDVTPAMVNCARNEMNYYLRMLEVEDKLLKSLQSDKRGTKRQEERVREARKNVTRAMALVEKLSGVSA